MKKDIVELESKGVDIVVSPRPNDANGSLWEVFVTNQNSFPITNVLISSKGYGTIDGREKITATLRHFIEEVPAESYALVEPIQTDVFSINNEYWVSYNHNGHMLEKKFIFQPNTISSSVLKPVKVLNREAVSC